MQLEQDGGCFNRPKLSLNSKATRHQVTNSIEVGNKMTSILQTSGLKQNINSRASAIVEGSSILELLLLCASACGCVSQDLGLCNNFIADVDVDEGKDTRLSLWRCLDLLTCTGIFPATVRLLIEICEVDRALYA